MLSREGVARWRAGGGRGAEPSLPLVDATIQLSRGLTTANPFAELADHLLGSLPDPPSILERHQFW